MGGTGQVPYPAPLYFSTPNTRDPPFTSSTNVQSAQSKNSSLSQDGEPNCQMIEISPIGPFQKLGNSGSDGTQSLGDPKCPTFPSQATGPSMNQWLDKLLAINSEAEGSKTLLRTASAITSFADQPKSVYDHFQGNDPRNWTPPTVHVNMFPSSPKSTSHKGSRSNRNAGQGPGSTLPPFGKRGRPEDIDPAFRGGGNIRHSPIKTVDVPAQGDGGIPGTGSGDRSVVHITSVPDIKPDPALVPPPEDSDHGGNPSSDRAPGGYIQGGELGEQELGKLLQEFLDHKRELLAREAAGGSAPLGFPAEVARVIAPGSSAHVDQLNQLKRFIGRPDPPKPNPTEANLNLPSTSHDPPQGGNPAANNTNPHGQNNQGDRGKGLAQNTRLSRGSGSPPHSDGSDSEDKDRKKSKKKSKKSSRRRRSHSSSNESSDSDESRRRRDRRRNRRRVSSEDSRYPAGYMTREEVDYLLAQARRDRDRDRDSDHITTTVCVTIPEKFTGDGKTSWTEWFSKWSQEVPNFFGKSGQRKIHLLRKATTDTANRVLLRILGKDESLEQGGKFEEVQELMRQQFMGPDEGYGSLLRDPKYFQKPGERVIDYEFRVRQSLDTMVKDNAFMTHNNIEPTLCHLLIYNLRPELAAGMKRFRKGYAFPQLLEEAEALEKDYLRYNGGNSGSSGYYTNNTNQIKQELEEVKRSVRQMKSQQNNQFRSSNPNYGRDDRRPNYGNNFQSNNSQNPPAPTPPTVPVAYSDQYGYVDPQTSASTMYCAAALYPPQTQNGQPAPKGSSYASKVGDSQESRTRVAVDPGRCGKPSPMNGSRRVKCSSGRTSWGKVLAPQKAAKFVKYVASQVISGLIATTMRNSR